MFYSLRDPVLIDVLDILRRYCSSQLTDTMHMLEENQQKSSLKLPNLF